MMTWADILHPIKMIRNIRNEWYERREARAIFDILEALEPLDDLEEPPRLRAKIMQHFDEHEARQQPAMENPASILSSATPAASVEGESLSVPENRAIILRCLYENWPNEVSMIGGDLVTQIVEEVLVGNRPEFRVPQGGFNFDLTPYMDKILNATILLMSMTQRYISVRNRRSHKTPTASDEAEPPDRAEETEEELVKLLAQYLTEEMAMERREATKLARMFIRISTSGHA